MVKCIIFDFDGTLVDTHEIYATIFKDLFLKKGLKVSKSKLKKEFGKIAEEIFKSIFPNLTQKEILSLLKEKEILFKKNVHLVKPLPCVQKKLIELHKNHILTIASSSTKKEINLVLSHLGWTEFFSKIITSYDVKNPKPHPDILLKLVKDLSLKKADCVFIGDSIYDALCAKQAGISFIGVETGSYKQKDFQKLGFPCFKNFCSLKL